MKEENPLKTETPELVPKPVWPANLPLVNSSLFLCLYPGFWQGIGVYLQILEKQAKLKIFLTAASKKSNEF
jgi:hypothetical protein